MLLLSILQMYELREAEESIEPFAYTRDVLGDRLMYYTEIDVSVFVNDPVAHSLDSVPWDVSVMILEGLCQLARILGDLY